MYLINTETLQLKSYIDVDGCPRYAILSHRWTDDEITYKDFVKGRRKDSAGYTKVLDFCNLAKQNGFEWAWVDTCCIDKRSSAELQESINSMFRYYERSRICYVHLADVTAAPGEAGLEREFQQSQWFARGWTLQELLAPNKIEFCSRDWSSLGRFGRTVNFTGEWYPTEQDSSFRSLVSRASGIQQEYLAGEGSIFDCSIACRMSWAAKRQTTRAEDTAYCLLGLFQVNMPLLYGEGKQKAFLRLQEAIIKVSDDHSLFAWTLNYPSPEDRSPCHGLLADEPALFVNAQDVSPSQPRQWAQAEPFELTSRGLKIVLPLLYCADDVYFARLDCKTINNFTEPTIILRKVSSGDQIFQRIFCSAAISPGPNRSQAPTDGWVLSAIYVQQIQSMYDQFWRLPKELFLLDPENIEPYLLQATTCTSSDGWVNIVQRSKLAYTQGGFLFRSLLSSRSAAISVKHSTTGEEFMIRIVAVSRCFVGFHVYLSPMGEATIPPHTKVVDRPIDTKNDVFETLTGGSLMASTEVSRLGSLISVASRRDKRWCHCVELGIKTVHEYGPEKRHILELKLNYKRNTNDGGGSSSYSVIPPTGFSAEILQQPSSVTLLRATNDLYMEDVGDFEQEVFHEKDVQRSNGLAGRPWSAPQFRGVVSRKWRESIERFR